eukprot:CAMPEP_0119014558 /NCGR_PEP_ID=MMETSP1176-20130426/9953_1 /TAXON_ID=265551 /ORGANISM="Synedropsis recta cf, Strain CCMP1620" /LENGTH=202 /DNA_ID=CAMNT_0006967759 /DNA_START=71 /DNA_END=678 /DNA_ORIENTATION=+
MLILEGTRSRSTEWAAKSETGCEMNERPDPPQEDYAHEQSAQRCCLPLFTRSRSNEGKLNYRKTARYQVQARDNAVGVVTQCESETAPVKTITITRSSDIRRIMDHDDFSLCEDIADTRIEPLSAAEKREMSKFLVDTRDESSNVSDIRRGIIAVYKDPSDPTCMVEIFRDRDGEQKEESASDATKENDDDAKAWPKELPNG